MLTWESTRIPTAEEGCRENPDSFVEAALFRDRESSFPPTGSDRWERTGRPVLSEGRISERRTIERICPERGPMERCDRDGDDPSKRVEAMTSWTIGPKQVGEGGPFSSSRSFRRIICRSSIWRWRRSGRSGRPAPTPSNSDLYPGHPHPRFGQRLFSGSSKERSGTARPFINFIRRPIPLGVAAEADAPRRGAGAGLFFLSLR